MIGFIIFGTKGITSTVKSGEFHCPECGGTQYVHKKVRRFFTLYFIPIIPLNVVGEFVECQRCGLGFDPEVLQWDPAQGRREFDAQFETAVKKVLMMMMLADGVIDAAEIETIQEIYEDLTGEFLAEDTIRAEAARLEQLGTTITQELEGMEPMLSPQGKEMVVRAAVLVAASDGVIDESEEVLFDELANALGVTPAHFRGIVDELFESVPEEPPEGEVDEGDIPEGRKPEGEAAW